MPHAHTDLVDGYLAPELKSNFAVSKHYAQALKHWHIFQSNALNDFYNILFRLDTYVDDQVELQ